MNVEGKIGKVIKQGGSRTTCLACNHCNITFENISKYVDTLTLFSKNLNQRSLTPRWPLTPCLLRSHMWLYPRIIVSKSHDNTSMYVDTVINFAKYHIHTYTYYVHTTYYVQNEWSHSLLLNSVQARQKWLSKWLDKKCIPYSNTGQVIHTRYTKLVLCFMGHVLSEVTFFIWIREKIACIGDHAMHNFLLFLQG